jgi:hypothetical protein
MPDEPHSVSDILDRLEELARKEGKVELGKVVETLGHRSYGPFLLIPALIDISPVGSIPTLPSVLAAVVVLISVQVLFGRKHLWIPGFLARRGLSPGKTCATTAKLRGVAHFLDRWFHGRLLRFTKGVWVKVAAACCIALAFTVPPLELLPLATTAPMAAIACFGLALLVRDGALMLAGLALSIVAGVIGAGLFGTRSGG